jgi:hypothetical protein
LPAYRDSQYSEALVFEFLGGSDSGRRRLNEPDHGSEGALQDTQPVPCCMARRLPIVSEQKLGAEAWC